LEVFTISENTIDKLKKKKILIVMITVIISMAIWGSLSFFVTKNIDVKIFAIPFCILIIFISIMVFFLLRYSIKQLTKKLKNVQYIIENEKIFMKQNELVQYNFYTSEIKCINKYKNNEVIIILNTNKKIAVNNYLDNYNKFIDMLNTIFTINKIDKSPKLDFENVDLTRLISFIMIITLIAISTIIINIFNINIPRVDNTDPVVLLIKILPIVILAAFSVFIAEKINKRIKNKKNIIIIFFSIEIVFLTIFLGRLFLESFKLGFGITLIMLFILFIQILFLYIKIRTENDVKNNN